MRSKGPKISPFYLCDNPLAPCCRHTQLLIKSCQW